jgi:hypothetical protein
MNPKFEELYLLTDDGRKLPAIEIFKNNGNLFFKFEPKPKPEPNLPRFCGLRCTTNDGRTIDFVANIETGEVVAYAIIPDGCTTNLLSKVLTEYENNT